MNEGMQNKLEQAVIIGICFIFSLGEGSILRLVEFVSPTISSHLQSGQVLILMFLVLYILTSLFARWRTILSQIRQSNLLCLIIITAFLSALWSINPGLTLLRSLLLTATTGFGIILSLQYGIEQQLKLVTIVIFIIAVVSFALIIMTSAGTMTGVHEGRWMGMFNHKTHLGRWMGVGMVAFFIMGLKQRGFLMYYWLGFFLCTVLLLGSRSFTSIISMVCCFLFFVFLKGLAMFSGGVPRRFFVIIFLIIGLAFFVWTNQNLESVLEMFDRDITLTDRTSLWTVLLDRATTRPILGYGHGAFWPGENASDSDEILPKFEWYPWYAHNGFLDIWLGIGLVGLTAFLIW